MVGGPTVASVAPVPRAGGFLGSGTVRARAAGQVGAVRANAAWNAASSSWAQGQVSGILIFRLRWPRTIRAAVCRMPVAQRLGFGVGQRAVQAEQPQPAQQVRGDGRGDAPGLVDRHRGGGEVVQAGGLPAADAVLDAGVGAVAGFEERQLAAAGVGGEQLVAPAVGLLQRAQLRPGRGAFAAADDPHVGRPVRQLVAAVRRCAAARSARPRPASSRSRGSPSRSQTCCQSDLADLADRGAGAVRRGRTRPSSARGGPCTAFSVVMWRIRSRVAPAPSTVTSRSRRCGSGIWVIASPRTSMWSLAVFDPALPGRSRTASDSPVLSHHAVSG